MMQKHRRKLTFFIFPLPSCDGCILTIISTWSTTRRTEQWSHFGCHNHCCQGQPQCVSLWCCVVAVVCCCASKFKIVSRGCVCGRTWDVRVDTLPYHPAGAGGVKGGTHSWLTELGGYPWILNSWKRWHLVSETLGSTESYKHFQIVNYSMQTKESQA